MMKVAPKTVSNFTGVRQMADLFCGLADKVTDENFAEFRDLYKVRDNYLMRLTISTRKFLTITRSLISSMYLPHVVILIRLLNMCNKLVEKLYSQLYRQLHNKLRGQLDWQLHGQLYRQLYEQLGGQLYWQLHWKLDEQYSSEFTEETA
jgi:hypothetical protein